MAYYESVFIARQEISAQQADALADTYAGVIADNGGEVTKREIWGLKTLAYRIKKNRKGHYVMFNIDGPSSAVQEMERLMRLNEDILRILTIKVDELEEAPSAQMQSRSRDGRYGEGDRSRHDDRPPRRDDNSGGEAKATPEAGAEKAVEPAADAKSEKAAEPAADAKSEEAAKPAADAKSEEAAKPAADAKSEEAAKPAADAEASAEADADATPPEGDEK